MEMRNKIQIKICGTEYTLAGREPKEYLQKIALYIDKKMSEISKHNGKLSNTMVSVLAAVNTADNYFKTQESEKALESKLKDTYAEIDRLNEEVKRLSLENSSLREKVNQLEDELLISELELEEEKGYNTKQKRFSKVESA